MSEEAPSQEFDHVAGWVKYFALISTRLMYWVGLLPFTSPELSFKLASARTFFSFVRLLIFTSPLLILPPIFLFGGLCKKEYEKETGLDWDGVAPSNSVKGMVLTADYYLNFTIYILPFAFAFVSTEAISKLFRYQIKYMNVMTSEGGPSFINAKHILFPILCFLLFTVGKLLVLLNAMLSTDYHIPPGLYINTYTNICYVFLSNLPLQFLLAMWENFLYQNFNFFSSAAKFAISGNNPQCLLKRARDLPFLMENIQQGFGFFLLVDISLMLIYWLLHTYLAYDTFQVNNLCL